MQVTGRRCPATGRRFETQDAAAAAAVARWEAEHQPDLRHVDRRDRYELLAAEMLAYDLRDYQPPTDGPGFIYLIRADPYVKIGYSNDPERRLSEVRSVGSATQRIIVPADLRRRTAHLWHYFLGSKADEDALHRLARNYWVCGEWFTLASPLAAALDVIAVAAAGTAREVA